MNTSSKSKTSAEDLEDMSLGPMAQGDTAQGATESDEGRTAPSDTARPGGDASGALVFQISKDAMTVFLHAPVAVPVSADDILAALANKRIVNGIDKSVALVAADRFHRGMGLEKDLVIARGQPAVSDWHLRFAFLERVRTAVGTSVWMADGVPLLANLRRILHASLRDELHQALRTTVARSVSAGELIATARRTGLGQPGKDVYGEIVDAAAEPLTAGSNVSYDENTGEFRSTIYGYLQLNDIQIDVIEPLWVAPNHMSAYFVALSQANTQVMPGSAELRSLLLNKGITSKCILHEAIESLCELFASGEQRPLTFQIAAGIEARQGTDACIMFAFDIGVRAGTMRADGSLDMRERNAVVVASERELIAEKILMTKGIPGCTIFGAELEATDGCDKQINIGKGVTVEESDDRIQYRAAFDGNVSFKQGTLSVADVFTVRGDVDYETGNLVVKTDILVSGSIRPGFSVKSSMNVQIQGMVEDGAQVVAGGNVSIMGGVVGSAAKIMSSGNVFVQFLQDAQVVAHGDVVIGSYAYNGLIRASGSIAVQRKGSGLSGKVVGGKLIASVNITVFVVGSDTCRSTILSLQAPIELSTRLRVQDKAVSAAAELIAKLVRSLPIDSYDPAALRSLFAKIPAEKKALVTKVLVRLSATIKEKSELEAAKKLLLDEVDQFLAKAKISILEQIHQGSTLQIGEHNLVVAKDMGASTFGLVDGRVTRL